MPRWRQTVDPETGKSVLVPIDAAARRQAGHAIHGDVEPFVSPIDGTVISDRRQLDEHCKKHNVVPAAEFTPEFYEKKAAERARLYNGERTAAEQRQNRQEIYEIMIRAEREAGW